MHLWHWFVIAAVVVSALLIGAMVWSEERRKRRDREEEFARTAAQFAYNNGGWPCSSCIRDMVAGFCTHRTPYEWGPGGKKPEREITMRERIARAHFAQQAKPRRYGTPDTDPPEAA